jgi:hypothetical protein
VNQLKAMTAAAAAQATALETRLAAAETRAQLEAAGLGALAVWVDQPTELLCQLYDQGAEAALAAATASTTGGQRATGTATLLDLHALATDCAARHAIDLPKLRMFLVNVRDRPVHAHTKR